MANHYLMVGLGNPGAEYAQTRHNAGFMALERFGARRRASWELGRKFNARVARLDFEGRKVLLCEPQTYMNSSGEAVGAVVEYYKVAVERLLVVVDDADLALGEIRLRARGSSGGHHGLESIEKHLGSRDYARLRIGIGRRDGKREITGHVLGRFGSEESELVNKVLDRAASQMECWLADGLAKAMNLYNGAIEVPLAKEK